MLTDPHLGERASPVGFAGPRRTTPPGLALDELPQIDLVPISHNHYDHLDLPTLRALVRRQREQPPAFYVPLGLAGLVRDLGAREVTAVQIHRDLEARQSIAMHWGTFILIDEPMIEPPSRLAAELERLSIPPEEFRLMRHRETLDLSPLLG